MKNKTKKVYFILFILLIGYFSIPVSMGASGTALITDWDDFLIGVTSGSNSFFEWEKTDGIKFIIEGSAEPTGDRYLTVMYYTGTDESKNSNGYFNFTSSANGFRMQHKGTADYYMADGVTSISYTFRNTTGVDVVSVRLYNENGDSLSQYKDYNDDWHTIDTTTDNHILNLSWNYYTDNTIQYIVTNESGGQIGIVNATGLLSGAEFTNESQFLCSTCYVSGFASKFGSNKKAYSYALYYYDSEFGYDYEYGNVAQYESLCEGGKDNYLDLKNNMKYIENRFDIPVTLTIKAVDLYVDSYQYNVISSSKSSYTLEINNIVCGNPTYFFDDGLGYTLRWYDLTIVLTNEKPLFEFKCNQKNVLDEYWRIGVNMEGGAFKYHNSDALFGNGVYDGGNSYSFGLSMCFYYESVIQNQLDYDDNIHSLPTGITTYKEYDSITFQYTVSSYYNTYIQLWYDSDSDDIPDTQFTSQGYGGYGLNVKTFAGTCNFVPYQNHDGEWSAHIVRVGSNVSTYNFTVENLSLDTDYNGQIWVTPSVTQINQPFTVGWLYNKTYYDNYDGISFYTKQANIEGETWIIKDGIKTSNEGGISYSIPWNGVFYIWLCVNEGNNKYVVIDNTILYCGINTFTNYLTTDKEHYELEFTQSSSIAKTVVTVGYSHMFLGGDVYIIIENASYTPYYVGETPQNELEFDFIYAGIYNIKLVYYLQDGSYEILDSKTITIGDTDVIPDEETQIGISVKDYLHETFDSQTLFFFGLAIILICTLIPLFISYSLTNEINGFTQMFNMTKEIDSVIYIMFAICGFATAIYLSLFDIYTIVIMFFIIGGLIAWYVSNRVGRNGSA